MVQCVILPDNQVVEIVPITAKSVDGYTISLASVATCTEGSQLMPDHVSNPVLQLSYNHGL